MEAALGVRVVIFLFIRVFSFEIGSLYVPRAASKSQSSRPYTRGSGTDDKHMPPHSALDLGQTLKIVPIKPDDIP